MTVSVGTPDALNPQNQTANLVLDVNSPTSFIFTSTTTTCLGCSSVQNFYIDQYSITYYPLEVGNTFYNSTEGWIFSGSTLGVDQICLLTSDATAFSSD